VKAAIDDWRGIVAITIRYAISRKGAMECGDVVAIDSGVEIRGWNNLFIGDHVSVDRGCYLDTTGGLTIGSNVSIAHQTSIITANHTGGDLKHSIRDNPVATAPVNILNDVWIGCGCRIMPVVTIQSLAVVASGSVVTRNIASGTLFLCASRVCIYYTYILYWIPDLCVL
jgi:acetyltransferase-like isoleucine patch superfamily enzyme